MIRNHIFKSDLVNRINLSDENSIQMINYCKLFYLALVRKFKIEKNIDFASNEEMDPFVVEILDHIINKGIKIIPGEIENFFNDKKIDFESFSLEISNKCNVCGKMSSIEINKQILQDEFEDVDIDATYYFCSTCFCFFSKRLVTKISKVGQKLQESEDQIEYYGNSILAAVYEAITYYNLEKMYSKDIIAFSNEVIKFIYKDDEKAKRYFIKLMEELSEDFLIYKMVFLNSNYNYSYPNYKAYI